MVKVFELITGNHSTKKKKIDISTRFYFIANSWFFVVLENFSATDHVKYVLWAVNSLYILLAIMVVLFLSSTCSLGSGHF